MVFVAISFLSGAVVDVERLQKGILMRILRCILNLGRLVKILYENRVYMIELKNLFTI